MRKASWIMNALLLKNSYKKLMKILFCENEISRHRHLFMRHDPTSRSLKCLNNLASIGLLRWLDRSWKIWAQREVFFNSSLSNFLRRRHRVYFVYGVNLPLNVSRKLNVPIIYDRAFALRPFQVSEGNISAFLLRLLYWNVKIKLRLCWYPGKWDRLRDIGISYENDIMFLTSSAALLQSRGDKIN